MPAFTFTGDWTELKPILADLHGSIRGRGLNVKDFGAVGNGGNDDTEAFKAALAAAQPGDVVYMPRGTYRLAPTTSKSQALVVPPGVTLEGEGYHTVLSPTGFSTPGVTYLFTYSSNTTFRHFRLDGRKDLRTAAVSIQFLGFYPLVGGGVSNVLVEDVDVHDIASSGAEGFGFGMGGRDAAANSNITLRRCRGWDCEGTPFHVDGHIAMTGDWATGSLTSNVLVEDLRGWRNKYHTLSVYGAMNVVLRNVVSYDNGSAGLNFEWCKDVTVYNLVAYNNGYAGVSTYAAANVRLFNCDLYDNNPSINSSRGEVILSAGGWYHGDPAPKAHAGTVEFLNCRIRPRTGSRHITYYLDQTVNIGQAIPHRLILEGPDVANWEVSGPNSGDRHPFVTLRGVEVLQPVSTAGAVGSWVVGGSMSRTAYSGSDGPAGAQTFTGINQGATCQDSVLLAPGKTYRFRMAVRAHDTGVEWRLLLGDGGNGYKNVVLIRTNSNAPMAGTWVSHDVVMTTRTDVEFPRLQLYLSVLNGTSSSLSLSPIRVEELSTSQCG